MYLLLGYRAFVVKVIQKKSAHLKLSRDLNFLREKSFVIIKSFCNQMFGYCG